MLLPTTVVTFVSVLTTVSCQRSCQEERLDDCALRVFIYGDPDHKFARTADQVLANCRKSREAEVCVRDHVKSCFKSPLIKQYFSLMMRGPSQLLKKSCSSSGVREVLRHADCLQASKGPLDACTRQAIRDTVRVSRSPDHKLFLPASCCHVSKAKECVDKALRKTCTGDSLEYMRQAVKAFQGEAFDLACGSNYDHRSAKCKDVLRKIPPLDPSVQLPKSILPVTLSLMSQFLS